MTPTHVAYIEHLLGIVPTMKGTYTVKFDLIHTHYSSIRAKDIITHWQIDQVVRAFIFYILGATFFCVATSSVDLIFLMVLRDVDLIYTYDWGSATLAYLY